MKTSRIVLLRSLPIAYRNTREKPSASNDEIVSDKSPHNDSSYYQNLFDLFQKADEKYNSGLFDFSKDRISERLKIDNKVIKNIITDLYFPSPYAFDAMPVEILGTAYEQFLGKVIRITPAHHAKIEEKPEVRKAGGVYYTPQYIVEYIVKNTIGKLIDGKTPKEISKIKIVDPACGSGSFLIGAYQYLLDWHKNYYSENGKPSKGKKGEVLTPEGNLTTSEKKRILLNNIYGVDIDVNAVEVTKLSLFLKCMEGETSASIAHQLSMFHERVLPTLDENIKDGNSLIDTDYYSSQLDFGDEKKIKPFNWEINFPEIFKQDGFDCVIGNPPYVKARDNNNDKDIYRNYLNNSKNFETLFSMWDLYIPFIEKGIKILKKDGMLGMIVPDTLEKAEYSELIKKYIINNFFVPQIDFFPNSYIFKSNNKLVGVKNIILFTSKTKGKQTNKIIHEEDYTKIKSSKVVKFDYEIFSTFNLEVDLKKKEHIKLGDICLVSYGLRLNSDKEDKKFKFKKSDLISDEKNKRCWKKYTEGKHLSNYFIKQVKYLEWNSERCPERLVRPTFPELYDANKILLGRQTRAGVLDNQKIVVDNTIIVCTLHHYFKNIENSNLKKYYSNLNIKRTELIKNSAKYDLKYLLGIINSSVTKYFLKFLTKGKIDAYPDDWKEIIIPEINFQNKNEKSLHDEIIKLVDQLLKLNEEKAEAKLETKINQLKSKIDYCESRINEIVYQLYGLTAEEIKIVEGK